MKKTIIKLDKFTTEFAVIRGIDTIITKLTYTTDIGIAQITVTANEQRMSTGGFHFTKFFVKVNKTIEKKFSKLSEIIGLEAISFAERLREFVVYG